MTTKRAGRHCAGAAKVILAASILLGGCAANTEDSGRIEIEVLNYKPEAVKTFEEIERRFNESHDDIVLKVSSPNEAMTILKTRMVREDYPDIAGIGGDINYSNFLDADLFMDISDLPALKTIKEGYLQIDKELELLPLQGSYALPFVANAAGVLYNKQIFAQHGWKVPETWDEFISLCEQMKSEGVLPLYAGYKDTWTTLAPWNAIAVSLAEPDVAAQVNRGETNFAAAYDEVAEKIKALLPYMEENPYAYSYNDAATAFANGQAAMWAIGSYAIPQIRSVNPDLEIGAFVFPACNNPQDRVLNSGIDLQFSIFKETKHPEQAKEVLEYLNSDEVISLYLEQQGGLACKKGDFPIPADLSDMSQFIQDGKVADFQDHKYPSEMAVDAMIQGYLISGEDSAKEVFLNKFDQDWLRYNRDLIRRVRESEEKQEENS